MDLPDDQHGASGPPLPGGEAGDCAPGGRESDLPRDQDGASDVGGAADDGSAGPAFDLSHLLRAWPVGGNGPTVRMVRLASGGRALQVRLELGVLQMALEGRPDGRRPHGAASLLDWHSARRDAHRARTGSDDGFELSGKDCEGLREEGVQVYHRYVALFALGEHEAVVRDAMRNLRMFDLCRDHGASHADRTVLEQYRPFVTMMRARAQAAIALAVADARGALAAVDAALAEMRLHFDAHGPHDGFDRSNEANLLRGMRDALVPRLPTSQRSELEERLRRAVDAENFELAAILRDELRALED